MTENNNNDSVVYLSLHLLPQPHQRVHEYAMEKGSADLVDMEGPSGKYRQGGRITQEKGCGDRDENDTHDGDKPT